MVLETIGLSTLAVAASEIGDKTQLLALCLAARYRAPAPIVLGILAATLANHVLAAALGVSLASILSPEVLRWVLIVSFVLMGFWLLVPDRMDDDGCRIGAAQKYGVFGATFVLFFLAEMGDKTQVATIALAAHYGSVAAVVCGTTLGMLIADVPAVFIGDRLSQKISMKLMRWIAAAIFFGLAAAAYFADAPSIAAAAS